MKAKGKASLERRRHDRRQGDAETALRRAEAKFATVFRVCPDLIAITSKATGKFIEVNGAFERIMGYSAEETVGRTSLELGTWESLAERNRMLAELGAADRLENFEVRFRRKGGEVFTALMSMETGTINGEDCLIIMARDISDRKRKEVLLRQTVDELHRSNIELERFAYVAAHDLQEPCRTICSFAQLLDRRFGGKLGAEGREYLDFLAQGASRMRDLIQGLLHYSRVGVGVLRLEEVDLGGLLADVVSDLAGALAAQGGEIEVAPLPVVRGDPSQLRQLFLNLISNGLKFQPDGRKPKLSVRAERDGSGQWCFRVADNGIGIAPEHVEQVFQVFQRLHGPDRYPGTGIGLSVARRVVEAHGGTIRVESIPGEGSTFVFTLGR